MAQRELWRLWELLTKVLNGVTYYCPRPQYQLSRLDASIGQKGISLATKILLERQPARVHRDGDGRLWLSDFVSPEELYARVVEDPMWFSIKVRERDVQFTHLKNILRCLVPDLGSHSLEMRELLRCLETLIDLQTDFLSFVYLPLIDEYLVQKLKKLVVEFLGTDLACEYVFLLLKPPDCFRKAIKSRIVFDEGKTLTIPPNLGPFFVNSSVDVGQQLLPYDARIAASFPESAVSSGLGSITEFALLRAIVPVLFQIGQEDLFIGKEIIVALSNCIHDIARILVQRGKLSHVAEVLDFDTSELLACARNI